MLRAIGIRQTDIEAELTAMADATIGTTASRRVLGSMNDFASMLDTHLEREIPASRRHSGGRMNRAAQSA
jgi:hypothetical protein